MDQVSSPPSSTSEIPRPVLLLWIGFLAASGLLWISCWVHHHLGYGPPYSTPFPEGLFTDLKIYFGRFETFHTAAFFAFSRHSHFAYPAGAAVIYQALYLTHRVRSTYCFLCAAWALLGALLFTRALRRLGLKLSSSLSIALSCSLAFPFLFLIQRGNIEIALWIFSSLGILAYMRRYPYLAAILWGVAAAIKIYPIFLVGIFLGRRREGGPFLAGIASALLTTLACLAYVGPSIGLAFRGFLGGVQGFQGAYAETVRSSTMGFDHSLFSLIKLSAVSMGYAAGSALHSYYLIAGTITALAFILRVRKLPFANRLTFLSVACISLPPVSFEYTLVHLYVPAALLLLYAIHPLHAGQHSHLDHSVATDATNRSLLWALACLLVLFLPSNLVVWKGVLYTGQVQIFPLLLLAALAAIYPWHNRSRAGHRCEAEPDRAFQPA